MKNFKKLVLFVVIASMVWMIGCTPKDANNAQGEESIGKDLSLKIGVMPAVDSAPIFLQIKMDTLKN